MHLLVRICLYLLGVHNVPPDPLAGLGDGLWKRKSKEKEDSHRKEMGKEDRMERVRHPYLFRHNPTDYINSKQSLRQRRSN